MKKLLILTLIFLLSCETKPKQTSKEIIANMVFDYKLEKCPVEKDVILKAKCDCVDKTLPLFHIWINEEEKFINDLSFRSSKLNGFKSDLNKYCFD